LLFVAVSTDHVYLNRIIETYQFLIFVEDSVRIFMLGNTGRQDTREEALKKISIHEAFDRVRRKFSRYRWNSPWTNTIIDELFSELMAIFRDILNYQWSVR
jgi:hypothetical protein